MCFCVSVKSLWVCVHRSPMRWDLRETFPVGKSKSFRALARDTGCRQELVQGSFQIKAFGGQDILKPTWASSILEFLLLVFKSLSCGEKHLLSAKTQRALEEKILCVNWEKTCRSLFSDPFSFLPYLLSRAHWVQQQIPCLQ